MERDFREFLKLTTGGEEDHARDTNSAESAVTQIMNNKEETECGASIPSPPHSATSECFGFAPTPRQVMASLVGKLAENSDPDANRRPSLEDSASARSDENPQRQTGGPRAEHRNALASNSVSPEIDAQLIGSTAPIARDPLMVLAEAFSLLTMELRRDKPSTLPKPTFSGKPHECPAHFVRAMSEWFGRSQMSDPQEQSQLAAAQLRDEARNWFEPMRPYVTSFGEFSRRLLGKFNNVEVLTQLRVELFGTHQRPQEGVEPFLMKKTSLFNRLYPNEPEPNRVELCLALLRPELRSRLRIGTFPTVESLLNIAALIASDLAEENRPRRINGATPHPGPSTNTGTIARAQPQTQQRQLPWRQNGPNLQNPQRREGQPQERTNGRVLALCDAQSDQQDAREIDVNASPPQHPPRCYQATMNFNLMNFQGAPRPVIPVRINKQSFSALLDTGSDLNLLDASLAPGNHSTTPLKTLGLACAGSQAIVVGQLLATLRIGPTDFQTKFTLVKNLTHKRQCAYIGAKERQSIYWKKLAAPPLTPVELPQNIDCVPSIQALVKEFQDLFFTGLQQPTTRTTTHRITLKEKKVDEMLRAGVIEHTVSAYSSPPVLVSRPGMAPRFCVDYRKLNDLTTDESANLPRIQDTVKALSTSKIFSVLDLKSGYWQVPLEESSKAYTAFSTPDGASYQFVVMPFGLKNAPSTFQKLMTSEVLPTVSAYSSPPVLVSRPGKAPRFCVDYRKLNDLTTDESANLPRIQDTVKALSTSKIFSVLDLKSGYWQVPLEESSKAYTAFSTPDGASYQFVVMPFGLKNAPSTFQKLMTSEVLVGLIGSSVLVYLDDIIVHSDTLEEHLVHLRVVFERLRLHNLKVSAGKCQLATDNLDYLGYHINGSTVEVQQKHLLQIHDFPRPRTLKQLQGFLGTCNWMREHVPHLSTISAPLTDLLKGGAKKFKWTPEAEEAFEQTKKAVASAQPLSRPDFAKEFVLQTDASSIGMSAVLYQLDGEKRLIISFASAKFKPAETRYHVNEQECLALIWGIQLYRGYLEDRPFLVRTDSKALTWLGKFKDTRAKLTRWALMLQEYSFTLEHVPGKHNELPDLLSRHPSEAEYQAEPNNDRLIPPDSQETESKPAVATIAASELFTSVVAGQAKVRHIRRTMVMLQLLEGRQEQTAAQQKLTRRFTTYDNLLWRRHPEGDRLVVPRQLVPKVLAYFHDSAEQAHPGYKETLRKIQERATGQSSYEVLINGRQWNVHVDDLRPAPPGNLEPIPDDDLDYASEGESEEEFEFGEDFRRTNEPPEEPMPSSPPRPESPTPGPSSVLTEEENTALAQIHAIRAQGRNQEPVPLEESSKAYTAFSTPDGASYQFVVMPFGLKNAPSTFQKLMTSEVLVGLIGSSVLVYLDDIIVHSDTLEEHLVHLRVVFERLRLHNLKVSAGKCQLATDNLDYLGYHINGSTVEVQQKHLLQIHDFPRPRTLKQLQGFLGTCNWMREHVPHLSTVSAPLTDLLKGGAKKFRWTPRGRRGTDASSIGMSAVLYQLDGEKRLIISFASAKFKPAETRIWACKRARVPRSDLGNPALPRLPGGSTFPREDRQQGADLEYSFTLEHVPGKHNELPDLLSRHPNEAEAEAEYEAEPNNDRLIPPDSQETETKPSVATIAASDLFKSIVAGQAKELTAAQQKLTRRFTTYDNLLWRRHPEGDRLVVPRQLVPKVLAYFHDSPEQAHPGYKETLRKIQERYFWGHMHLEIQRYTHQCLICATAKAQQRQNAAPMTARSSRYPFEMLALDILGPYPEIEDVFSRWLEAKAFPEIHGRDIATYLEEEMFSRYGAPRVIISDNGTPFTSNAFQRLCRERQIQHRTTSVYHQRAKTSERRAQELKKVLRILLTGKPENQWGKYLSSALKVLRSRKNRATGETPASIVLGYELPCPGDWSTQYAKYRRTLTPQQRKNHNREVFERQLVFQKEYSSDVRPPVSFAPSDKVMTKNRQPGAFGPKWTGPWDIITATGQSTYKVLINGRQWNVHVDDLRPAPPGNPEPIPDDDIDYASESESEEEFEFGEDFRRTSEPSEEPMPSSPPRPESPTPGPSSVLTEEENTALAQIHAIRAQGRTKEPLTKHMLKLDTVDTRKILRLRAERKQAIEELESLAQRVEATNANQESVGIPRAPEGIGFPTSIPRVPNPVVLRGMNPKKGEALNRLHPLVTSPFPTEGAAGVQAKKTDHKLHPQSGSTNPVGINTAGTRRNGSAVLTEQPNHSVEQNPGSGKPQVFQDGLAKKPEDGKRLWQIIPKVLPLFLHKLLQYGPQGT
ncbi:hypothetical protein HUJ05_007705 [Dendroctonus ponderosae]|nr:hypothetical protein HUJ05_007705 [Dendroctonus ponderosae]